jgi:hypothetical protein
MTQTHNASALDELRTNDPVRLLVRHGDLPAGAIGRIVGWFARSNPTYVVRFAEANPCVEVLPAEIVRAEAHEPA